jgi:hypothetical protein
MVVIMIVIHHQDQNLVKNRNQFDHLNVVQGLFILIIIQNSSCFFFSSSLLDQKNVVDLDHLVIENVVHVLDHLIVIDVKKIHVNDHVHIHVHVRKDVIIVVKVEKIKNLDDKYIHEIFVMYNELENKLENDCFFVLFGYIYIRIFFVL